jgi:hypothetical protein
MNQPANPAPTPYGHQQQPQQPYVPVSGKRPGSTSTKVWGIILLILGLLVLLNLLASLGMIFGGVSGSSFAVGVDEAGKRELDEFMSAMIDETLGRWTFWFNTIGELVIAVISVVAGWFLAIRPRPRGRSLAISRALLVLLLLPIYGIETTAVLDAQADFQQRFMERSVERQVRESSGGRANKQEVERRARQARESIEGMGPIMRGVFYGAMIFTVICVLIVNGLLLFFMTRPAVKTYLEDVVREGDHSIPQYDPSMGIMTGPPPDHQTPPQNTPPDPDGRQGPNAL